MYKFKVGELVKATESRMLPSTYWIVGHIGTITSTWDDMEGLKYPCYNVRFWKWGIWPQIWTLQENELELVFGYDV